MSASLDLIDFLSDDTVQLNCAFSSKKRLFVDLAAALARAHGGGISERDVFNLLIDREKMGNTGVGNGVALPHSRCANVKEAILAVFSVPAGVDYDSIDGKAVKLVFGLLVPEAASNTHLALLSKIAQTVESQDRVDQLVSVDSKDQFMQHLEAFQLNAAMS